MSQWSIPFFQPSAPLGEQSRTLIILNQPFSVSLFDRLWNSCKWHYCADGGANRLYDLFENPEIEDGATARAFFLPDLIKGDFDSLREDVKDYYVSRGVTTTYDEDQYSTDLMKCISATSAKEAAEGQSRSDIVLLGGLSGRLDHTIHTLSYLHKLRKTRRRIFAVSDDNIGWVLDEGEHFIQIDHNVLGPTCGLLPVGIDSTLLSTTGLRWNLTNEASSFDGLVSTSNHLVPEEDTVWIKTSKPIWWSVELRKMI